MLIWSNTIRMYGIVEVGVAFLEDCITVWMGFEASFARFPQCDMETTSCCLQGVGFLAISLAPC